MAKYKDLSKKDRFYFWVGIVAALVYLLTLGYVIWSFAFHLYHHEWLKAQLQIALFFVGWFWNSNRKNKKKVKELQAELLVLKIFRNNIGSEKYKEGFQHGIDFQRRILLKWVEQRTGQKLG